MVSLPEELQAREATARQRVEELEAEAAELAGRLDQSHTQAGTRATEQQTIVFGTTPDPVK
jgi:hypothetical protein